MARRMAAIIVTGGLCSTPALAQKVTIDYAHDFDFSSVQTFQYVPAREAVSDDPLLDGRIREALVQRLETDGGLREVNADPDVLVTYHLNRQDRTSYETDSFGYGGFGPGWGCWGCGIGTITPVTYTVGTLIIDGYKPDDRTMIWRGTGTVDLSDDPEKQTKQVNKIIDKLGKRWDKILDNEGK
ncbi:MAG TPA: DUF4136 domain-containing protein [Gammaproteobacteria bacterium]